MKNTHIQTRFSQMLEPFNQDDTPADRLRKEAARLELAQLLVQCLEQNNHFQAVWIRAAFSDIGLDVTDDGEVRLLPE